jgi:hypothetical protein
MQKKTVYRAERRHTDKDGNVVLELWDYETAEDRNRAMAPIDPSRPPRVRWIFKTIRTNRR